MAWADFSIDTQRLMREQIAFDGDDMAFRYTQDVEPFLQSAAAERAEFGSQMGEMTKVATVPNVVIMEMRTKFGVDFYNKNHKAKVIQLINTEYPHLKTREIII